MGLPTLTGTAADGTPMTSVPTPPTTWIYWANVFFFQWLWVRVFRVIEDDGTVSAYGVLGFVLPLSGWWTNFFPRHPQFKIVRW